MFQKLDDVEKHYDEDWALYLKLLANQVHPVHVPVIGFWYRKSAAGMQQTVRKNEQLRKVSDTYIRKLAKEVKHFVKAEMYTGTLPKNAVHSEYSRSDALIAAVCTIRPGCFCIKKLYEMRKNHSKEKTGGI